jgi:hypothetical protein
MTNEMVDEGLSPHFLAVFFDSLNAFSVGAPFEPGFLIFSPEPFLMRSRLA